MHLRLRDVLNGHGYVVLPHEHLLVIRGCHELATLVEEVDRVASLQVVVILLAHAARARIPLVDAIVRCSAQEYVVVVRVKLDCATRER